MDESNKINRVISIILIDDHEIVRKGIKELIQKLGNYKILCEFHNGVSFISKLDSLKNIPDLFILDYSMPLLNGIEVLKKALQINNEFKFLLLTQHFEEEIINEAYSEGARGFLHKTCSSEELKYSIDNIIKYGYTNISDILKRVRNYNSQSEISNPFDINEKELTFLEWVCDEHEYTYKEIANKMGMHEKTIDFYRASLFEKFDVKSKVGLVLQSFRYKITKPFNNIE